MSGIRQISPTGSVGATAVASFGLGLLGAGPMEPVVLGAAPVVTALDLLATALDFPSVPVVLGAPFAMLLTGLEGIGPATRVQVSPPQRKPSTQPRISSWSVPTGLIVDV